MSSRRGFLRKVLGGAAAVVAAPVVAKAVGQPSAASAAPRAATEVPNLVLPDGSLPDPALSFGSDGPEIWRDDPEYRFRLAQGQQAIERSKAAEDVLNAHHNTVNDLGTARRSTFQQRAVDVHAAYVRELERLTGRSNGGLEPSADLHYVGEVEFYPVAQRFTVRVGEAFDPQAITYRVRVITADCHVAWSSAPAKPLEPPEAIGQSLARMVASAGKRRRLMRSGTLRPLVALRGECDDALNIMGPCAMRASCARSLVTDGMTERFEVLIGTEPLTPADQSACVEYYEDDGDRTLITRVNRSQRRWGFEHHDRRLAVPSDGGRPRCCDT